MTMVQICRLENIEHRIMKQVFYNCKYSLSASRVHHSHLQFYFVVGDALVVVQYHSWCTKKFQWIPFLAHSNFSKIDPKFLSKLHILIKKNKKKQVFIKIVWSFLKIVWNSLENCVKLFLNLKPHLLILSGPKVDIKYLPILRIIRL